MALGFPFGFRVANPEPLDNKYGPYANTGAAIAAVLQGERYQGLTVNVAGVEYWWRDGVLDGQLIVKSNGGGGVAWQLINVNTVAEADKGYITNSAAKIEVTINADFPYKTIRVTGINTGGWRIQFANPVTIVFLDEVITDSIESTLPADAVELLNVAPNTWQVISCVGNLLLTNAAPGGGGGGGGGPVLYDFTAHARAKNIPDNQARTYYRVDGGAWTLLDARVLGIAYANLGTVQIEENASVEWVVLDHVDANIGYGVGQDVADWSSLAGNYYGPILMDGNKSVYFNVDCLPSGIFIYP